MNAPSTTEATEATESQRVRGLVIEATEAAASLIGRDEVAEHWNDPSALAGTQPITRFYFDQVAKSSTGVVHGSHFYTLVDAERSALIGINPGNANAPKLPFSEGTDSFAMLPVVEGVGGRCASGLTPVLRLFRGNTRFPDNPNHRFTTSTAIYNSFVALGWDGEGVKFCVPG